MLKVSPFYISFSLNNYSLGVVLCKIYDIEKYKKFSFRAIRRVYNNVVSE